MKKQLRNLTALIISAVILFSLVPVKLQAALITTDYSGGYSLMGLLPVTKTHTYNFVSNGSTVSTQIVKNGEYLFEPAAPELPNKHFTGWYLESSSEPLDFTKAIQVEESGTFTVEARYTDLIHVHFLHDNTDDGVENYQIIKTKKLVAGQQVDPSDVQPVITVPDRTFGHWSATINGPAFDFTQPINSNTNLYLVLMGRYTVIFDTGGGTYVPMQHVEANATANKPTDPTRMGYSFSHWSLTAGGLAYDFTTPVTGAITLHAVWQPAMVPYIVAYWQENPNDDGYTPVDVVDNAGLTGTDATFANQNYTGFELNTVKTAAAATNIKADGSTVRNVYYSRKVYTLTIMHHTGSYNSWITYSTTQLKYGESTAVPYNAYIADKRNLIFIYKNNFNEAYGEAPDMPNKNLTMYGAYSGYHQYTSRYRERINGKNTTIEIHPDYVFYASINRRYIQEAGIAIKGFTATLVGTWDDFAYYGYYYYNGTKYNKYRGTIYYTRNSYDIVFHKNNGDPVTTLPSILYEADISDKALDGFTVGETTYEKDGMTYVFAGWYDNDGLVGDPYSFAGKTMPAGDLLLYAKWTPPTYKVYYHEAQNQDSAVIHTETVSPGAVAPNIGPYPTPPPPGLTEADWVGWYWYSDGKFVPYSFPAVMEDTHIYPVWKQNPLNVTYDLNGGTGSVVDSHDYVPGTSAVVKSAAGVTPPDTDKVFLGWKLDGDTSGKIYYPGESLLMQENAKLVAQWGPVPQPVSLTYYANGGVGGPHSVALANNATHTVLTSGDTGISNPGYTLVGWNTSADGSGQMLQPGDNIMVDNIEPETNALYAMWGAIEITKVASLQAFTKPGTVTYTYTVKNTGNVTLTGIKVSDDKLGAVTLGKTTLAPGESTTGSKTYYVTQGDIDAGKDIVNVATVTTDQGLPEKQAKETVKIQQTPAATITKVADPKTFSKPGTVTYTYTVENTGNVTLTGLQVNDDKLGAVTLNKTTLAPGESATGTKTYQVSQADIDAGKDIKNVATLTANQEIPETKADETITVQQTPAAKITKVADPTTFTKPGTVTYTYTVENTGNVTLTGLEVIDDKLGAVTLKKTTLAPGESTTGTETYNVTQDDIDAGQEIKNVATLTADQEIPETKADETVTVEQLPAAKITKVADQKTFTKPGTVTYTYTVTNTGNVTLTGLEVNDDKLGAVTLKKTTLAPGESTTGTKIYEVTQTDINAGVTITNVATLKADQSIPETKAQETITATAGPAVEITKVADPKTFTKPGTVTYTYTVTNTGNVTLTGLKVIDDKLGEVELNKTILEPGDSATGTKTYNVSQADIDAGKAIKNVATVTADQELPETKADETITMVQTPAAEITKVADPKTFTKPGTVTYTYTVKNTGNVTLTGLTVNDDKLGEVTLKKTTLAPGESTTGTKTYNVTQADIDAGKAIKNVATLRADQNIPETKADETITMVQTPKARITKVADPTTFTKPGTVTYTYTVTNTGNVTLTGLQVSDDKLGTVTLNKTTLAPGESATGTKTYKVSQADIDAGKAIQNVATLTADQEIPETKADETISVEQLPAAQITKEADQKLFTKPGTVIYTYTVTNTGNVTLTGLTVSDDKLGAVTLNKTTLAPGESATGAKTYQVSQADIDAGKAIKNVATLRADQKIPETKADETITVKQTPAAEITKVADPKTFTKPGTVTYTYTVKNTGNVTLTGLKVSDDKLGDVELKKTTLAPGESTTGTKTYYVTQDDIDAGQAIKNVATLTADQEIPETKADETISVEQL
ncbi:MAG: InlB B-repeat-containing protein, partial [Bacillota bacterium]|nr:InlB B-repeat-containing protein [Bacillota bacterium]